MIWNRAAAVTVVALVSVACGESKAPAPAGSPAVTMAAPATTAPVATASEFGVPECDAYMNKWLACVDSKVPESMRANYRTSIEQSKASWKAAAATPEGRAALASTCTQSLEATKQALASYNCTW
jgi:hypothetical protein